MANRTTNSITDLAYQISLVNGVSAVVPPEEDNPNGHSVLITNKFKVSGGYSEMLTI